MLRFKGLGQLGNHEPDLAVVFDALQTKQSMHATLQRTTPLCTLGKEHVRGLMQDAFSHSQPQVRARLTPLPN